MSGSHVSGKFILTLKLDDGFGYSTRVFDNDGDSAQRSNVDADFTPRREPVAFRLNVPDVKCDIVVRTNDPGFIPHFHILDSGTHGGRMDICVKIAKAEYFSHGCHKGELNSGQRRRLDEFLSIEETYDCGSLSNWDRIVAEWNKNNSKAEIPASTTKPDYRTLR